MTRIEISVFSSFLISILFFITSCATITVNVYFPAEEVREAYSSLEEEFLKTPSQEETETEKSPKQKKSIAEPQSLKTYSEKPTLTSKRYILFKRRVTLNLGNYAWAQDDVSKQITDKIRKMPDVIKAFQNRGKRVQQINAMLSEGKVGEGNKGLLVKRGTLTSQESSLLNAENADRNVIENGMARAIVEINGLDPTPDNINSVLPETAEQFAAVRRSEAQTGWFIQLPDGSWEQK